MKEVIHKAKKEEVPLPEENRQLHISQLEGRKNRDSEGGEQSFNQKAQILDPRVCFHTHSQKTVF